MPRVEAFGTQGGAPLYEVMESLCMRLGWLREAADPVGHPECAAKEPFCTFIYNSSNIIKVDSM